MSALESAAARRRFSESPLPGPSCASLPRLARALSRGGWRSAGRRRRRRVRGDVEATQVFLVELAPAPRHAVDVFAPSRRRALEMACEPPQADVPAGAIARGLEAASERVREHQQAARAVGAQLPRQPILAPRV